MKQKSKVIIGVLILVGVAVLCWAPGYIEKARESEARASIASVVTSLRAFYTEYSEYTNKFEAIGFTPREQQRYHLYLDEEKICPGVRAKLKEYQKPFVQKKNYRIVAIGYNSIFIQEMDKPLVHEKIEVSLKELSCDVKEN